MADDKQPHAWSGGLDEAPWVEVCRALVAVREARAFTTADPVALLAAAERVGVGALVRTALGMPVDDATRDAAARSRTTLTAVAAAFTRAGLVHAFWKGSFADLTLWGGRGLRVGDDVDVLVMEGDWSRARHALAAIGFVPQDADGKRAQARTAKAWPFHSVVEGRAPVDLHRRPLNDPPFSSASADVLAHAETFDTPSGPLPGAAAATSIPWIAGNLAGGRFQGLARLAADASVLWPRVRDPDAVVTQARAWRAESATWGLLRLLETRFDVAVAASVLAALRPRPPMAHLVERAFGAVGAPRMPVSKADAVLLMDWPLAGHAGFLAEKVVAVVQREVKNRIAQLTHTMGSRPLASLAHFSSRENRMPVTVSSKVVVPPEVLLQEIDGESVLLDLRSEKYFGLDESGTTLFAALKERGTVQAAIDAGLAAFEVERDVLTADVLELVEALAAEGLLLVEG